jgi:hypothetical protein
MATVTPRMRLGYLIAVCLIVSVLLAGCGEAGPSCSMFRFDRAAWQGADANHAPIEGSKSPRQEVQAGLLKCVRLKGRTHAQIETLPGAPNDRYPEPGHRVTWAYDPGVVGFDYERLHLLFSRGGRVIRVIHSVG